MIIFFPFFLLALLPLLSLEFYLLHMAFRFVLKSIDESMTSNVWFFLLPDQFFQNYTQTICVSLIANLSILQMEADTKPLLPS